GVQIARHHGFDAAFIESNDLRVLMLAAETCFDGGHDLTMVLCIGKMGLMRAGLWGAEWTDRSLVSFARSRRDDPVVHEGVKIILAIHDAWAEWFESDGPMYTPPIRFGKLNQVRMGLALAKLARLTQVPVEWLFERFAQICRRRD